MYSHSPSEVRLNRSWGHFLCFSFLRWSFVCVQSTKGSANKQDIHHLDRQNKLHTEENLNVSPRLIVSRPAAGEPALSPASVHPLGLLLDVRLITRHRCEHSKLKHFKKHWCYINTLFVFVRFLSEALHIQTVYEGCFFTASKQNTIKVTSFIILLSSNLVWWWQLVNFMQYDLLHHFELSDPPKKTSSSMYRMNKKSLSNGITIVFLNARHFYILWFKWCALV